MAMKGGQYGHNNGQYNYRRRWNVYLVSVIVLLVFGAGILGVMGIHRLRDRRIFDLVTKDKDQQIMSLQLLLQKEREQLQDVKMKNEEMKMKMYNLRSQNTELNGRVLEMQSTISSLKDEQKTIELAFEEKQNEVKLLRQRLTQFEDLNPQVKNLTEMLTQKEAEIQDLKRRLLELNVKARSDSIPPNITANANIAGTETMINQSEDTTTMTEKFTRLESPKENGKSDDVEAKTNFGNEAHTNDANERPTMGDGQSKTISNDQGSGNQDSGELKGGVKLEMRENSHTGSYRLRGRRGYLKRVNGKRWRSIAKQTDQPSNTHDEEKPINQDKIQDSITGLNPQNSEQDGNRKVNLEGYVEEKNGGNTEDSPPGNNSVREVANVEKGLEGSLTNSSSVKSYTSLDEAPKYTPINSEPEY